jgi:hypothetical protein
MDSHDVETYCEDGAWKSRRGDCKQAFFTRWVDSAADRGRRRGDKLESRAPHHP